MNAAARSGCKPGYVDGNEDRLRWEFRFYGRNQRADMRVYSLIVVLLFATAGTTMGVDFANRKFNVEKVGNKYFVFQSPLILTIEDVSDLAKNDCNQLASEVEEIKKVHFLCDKDENSSGCRVLKRVIAFKSKEENFQSPVLFYPVNRTWRLSQKGESPDVAALKFHVAATIGVNEEDIVIEANRNLNDAHLTLVDHTEASLLASVTKIVPLAPDHLDPLHYREGRIMTNNRFLACDLEHGNVRVAGKGKLNLSYIEAVPDDHIEAIWKLYTMLGAYIDTERFKSLSNLMQAAHLGRKLGLAMHENGLEKSYRFERMIEDLFLMNEWNVTVKSFDAKDDLRERQYPPQRYSKDVEVAWSIQ